nr:3'-5' exonuclease [Trabulsiella odontotermitis]
MAVYHQNRVEHPSETALRWIRKNYLILDTETTGLGTDAKIVEIAIIDCTGKTLLNTLVNPGIPIPPEATAIHGITDEMVRDAPTWRDIERQVTDLLDRKWIAYNASFDARMLRRGAGTQLIDPSTYECAMQLYAEHRGLWDTYRRKYRWAKLVDAAVALNVASGEGNAHRALYDCQQTLGVIRAIAGMKHE